MTFRHTTSTLFKQPTVPILILFLALVPLASNNVLAQEAEDSANNRAGALEEIVVSARKRDENLQEVPISIEVFSGADIDAKSLTSLKELSQFAPNLNMYNQGIDGSLTNDVLMRGVGNSLGGPGVGIYLDGVYLSTQQAIDLGMLDIERVELLFGPQGTLFGRNTIGGAISYVSKKPTGEFSGNAQLDVGSYNRLDAKVNLNGPLIPGKLNARFSLGTQNRDGYMKVLDWNTNIGIDELGNRDRWSARLLLDWIVSDDVSVLFSLEGNEQDEKATARTVAGGLYTTPIYNLYNNVIGVKPPIIGSPTGDSNMLPPNLYSTYATYRGGLDNVNYMEAKGGSMTVDWNIDTDLSFKSITSYREYHTAFGSDFDFTMHDINIGHNFTDQEQWSQEFQLVGNSFDNRLDWVTGLYYFSEDAYDPSVSISYKDLIDLGLIADSRRWIKQVTTDDSWAAFGEGSFDFTDKLSGTFGLRYTYVDKSNYNERTSISAGGDWNEGGYNLGEGGYTCSACQLPAYGEESYDDTSGRVNLSYRWTDDVMTYISAARGFKSGGLENSVVNASDQVPTLLPYLPEVVWTYELGLKSTMLDQRLRLNATAFFSDYEDIQYQFFYSALENGVARTVSVVSNAAAAEIKGFEMSAIFEPVDGLTFTASVGHTDAKYTKADERGGPVTVNSVFTRTPEWSYALSGVYNVSTGWGDLNARLDYSWADTVYFDVTNTTYPWLKQDAFGLLNGRISLDLNEDWSVAVFGTNLTDEEYIVGAYQLLGFGLPAFVQPGAPREWGVSASVRF